MPCNMLPKQGKDIISNCLSQIKNILLNNSGRHFNYFWQYIIKEDRQTRGILEEKEN